MHSIKAQSKKDLIAVFLEHVRLMPDFKAIQTSDTSWTYQALFLEVCAWKKRLKKVDVQTPMVICLHRTPRMISILLALQWLEIPYIPLEPQMPLERIRAMIDDSQAGIILHDTGHHEAYSSLPCKIYAVADLEQINAKHALPDTIDMIDIPEAHSSALAYIIYTSGSTGTPKGVCISKQALNHFLGRMSAYFLNAKHEMLLATTTITFDIAALELYLPLWQGKTLFLTNEAEHKDPICIQQLLKKHPITLLQSTSSFWNMLHYAGWSGKKDLVALCGGEPLSTQTAENILSNVSALWNMYGPTEATIWCALKQIQPGAVITVGRPIDQMEMWVLDAQMEPVSPGIKGELYISGVGLAEGYLNREALTKERFVFYKKALGQRVYRTGDVACMTPEGEFIILGRVDNQIKLHGYRIELEDIETHIQGCPGVRECGVVVYQEQLIAYICQQDNKNYSETKLYQQLARELPEFMIPKRVIYLDQLPMNSSGKLNRHALPEPKREVYQETNDVTPLQAELIAIWRDALNVSNIRIDDNFFELGGHSLLAARITAEVQKTLGKVVRMQDIYHAPSIIEFIEILNAAPSVSASPIQSEVIKNTTWMPLTDFQFVLWMSHLFASEVKKLNIVGRRRIVGSLNQKALNLALQALIRKHDVLSYAVHRFVPIQKKKSKLAVKWHEVSLKHQSETAMEAALNQSMQDLYAHQAWSKNKPLIIAKLFYLTDSRIELQIAMPHMISDQQSLGILFQDLSDAYLFYLREVRSDVYIEEKAFELYARQEHTATRSSGTKGEAFWKNYLKDAELLSFPKHHVVSLSELKKQQHNYSTFFPIEAEQLKQWRGFCTKNAVTLNDMLCAAIAAALQDVCQADMKIPKQLFMNTVKSTREAPCFDEVIGCFLKTQAIKLDLTGEKNIEHLAKQARQSALETAAHQSVSSLIKLASIGQLDESKHKIKPLLITLLTRLSSKMRRQPYYLSKPILDACKRLAKLDSNRGFVVNVNIWHSFFGGVQDRAERLFGSTCEPLGLDKKDIFTINEVLDVCLLKDSAEATSFLVLSANLKPEFREQLGQKVLDVLT